MLPDDLLEPFQRILGAGIDRGVGIDHPRKLGCVFLDPFHIHHSGNVHPAVADKDPHTRRKRKEILVLRGKLLGHLVFAASLGQQFRNLGRRPAGLHHAFRNVLRPLKGPGHVDPGLGGEGIRHRGPGETEGIKFNPESLGQFFRPGRGRKPHRKHHQIEKFPVDLSVLGHIGEPQPSGNLLHLGHPGIDRAQSVFFHRPLKGRVKALALGAHIHEKEGNLGLRRMLLEHGGLFHGVHAADRRTERPSAGDIPRTHALKEGDLPGMRKIRGP